MFTVVKPFSTPARRFKMGARITESDIAGPLTPADWAALGYLKADKPQMPEKPGRESESQ